MSRIHLSVADLNRRARFPRLARGMAERHQRRSARHGRGSPSSPSPPRPATTATPRGDDPTDGRPKAATGAVAHRGFRRRDPASLDQAIAKVTAAGGRLVERGQQGSDRLHTHVADPDSYVIQRS